MVVLDLGSSPTPLSTRLLLALSKPGPSHQKHAHVSDVSVYYEYTERAYGGPGGNRTRVQNTFCSASYSDNTIYFSDSGTVSLRSMLAGFNRYSLPISPASISRRAVTTGPL